MIGDFVVRIPTTDRSVFFNVFIRKLGFQSTSEIGTLDFVIWLGISDFNSLCNVYECGLIISYILLI